MNDSRHPLSIGLFARLTGLPPSALRYYDEIDLLKPSAVDADSRYRTYAAHQIGLGRGLATLRAMDCPVTELKRYVESAARGEQVAFLSAFRQTLLGRAHQAQEHAAAISLLMRSLEETMYDIRLVEQPAFTALTVTQKTTDRSEVGRLVVEGFNRHLWPFVHSRNHPVLEPAVFICLDEGESASEVVVAAPSERAGEDARVKFRTVPGGQFLQTVHVGPYQTMGAAYEALLTYAQQHGLRVLPETREVYLVDYRSTDHDDALRTQVMCRVG